MLHGGLGRAIHEAVIILRSDLVEFGSWLRDNPRVGRRNRITPSPVRHEWGVGAESAQTSRLIIKDAARYRRNWHTPDRLQGNREINMPHIIMCRQASNILRGTRLSAALIVCMAAVASGYEPIETSVKLDGVPKFKVKMTPVDLEPDMQNGGGGEPRGPGCPQQQRTYVNPSLFQGGTYLLQAGTVEMEIMAASYQITAAEFPLRIDTMEFVLGTQNAVVQTVTQYTILVWEGSPNTGDLIFTFSSDDLILPHARIGPGTAGLNIMVSVDPGDPEQIIVSNNGSQRFSIGLRIDDHHDEPTASCQCVPGCGICGTLPALCCPPNSTRNAFPATDNDGVANPSNNWLYARDCPGATGFCAASEGWLNFSGAGMPNGDWVIRASYTPFICPGFGACCNPSTGVCQVLTETDCQNSAGNWQGEATNCSPNPCPQPQGACCKVDGSCVPNATLASCNTFIGEQFYQNTPCSSVECIQPMGACCTGDSGQSCVEVNADTCASVYAGTFLGGFTSCSEGACEGACCVGGGGCVPLSQGDCSVVPNSQFQGIGVACAPNDTCPVGACCLPSGSCTNGTVLDCNAQDGVYQGTGTSCGGVNCPQPTGACCFSNGSCLGNRTLSNCNILGGSWAGANTTCPGACQPPCPAADGDMNGDTLVDAKDLPLFVTALMSGGTQDEICSGDFNGSGALDVGDIDGMVAALLAGP